ncbi:glycosyltransferase [Acidovorax sp. SDU_ACID1]|uniref:glycosyltransferase n=1 Tax=Acidovorax sp. SDU_ACID1 TaxID=3136632 RepID=UPI003872E541
MRVLVFSATYDEAGNIGGVLNGTVDAVPYADILVVDDASTDGTVAVMRGLQLPQLTIIERPGKMGLGSAHLLAFCHAMHCGYDVLVSLDADGSHQPCAIPLLIEKIREGNDFVIGSRYCAGGRCDYTGYRLHVSQVANRAARRLLGIALSEFTTSFRAFRVTALRRLWLPGLRRGGYSFFMAAVVEGARNDFQMVDVPIHFLRRGYGVSKIAKLEIFRGMATLLQLAVVRRLPVSKSRRGGGLAPCRSCASPYAWIEGMPSGAYARDGGGCVQCGANDGAAV